MSQPRSKNSSELARCPALYRARLSCKVGRDIISGETKPPCGLFPHEYALYNLLDAVADIARALADIHFPAETIDSKEKPTPRKSGTKNEPLPHRNNPRPKIPRHR